MESGSRLHEFASSFYHKHPTLSRVTLPSLPRSQTRGFKGSVSCHGLGSNHPSSGIAIAQAYNSGWRFDHDLAQVSIDPNNSQGLKMINEVDIAWNEEWTGTSQTGFLSLDGNGLTIRTL